MEKLSRLERMGGWVAAAGFAVFAAMVADNALAATSIAASKHNLGTTGTGSVRVTTGTDEVCVFCHTPHGGDTAKSAPLWNRGVNAPASYTLYDGLWGDRPSTFDGETATGGVGSISLLCLSCHDGATALDMLINAPGSGGYNATGASAGYTWQNVVSTNLMDPARIATIGTDLKNDHPISVPYCGGMKSGGAPVPTTIANCKDQDFNAPATGSGLYWIETGTANGTREKTDLPLYVRAFGGTTAGPWPAVECGSCHDPHNADTPTFLRIANTQSQVCLSCHVK